MKQRAAAGTQLSFRAVLENWAEGMDYCAVSVPAEVTEALGTKGPVLVMAQVNESTAFQVSLFPAGGGQHYIRIKAKIRKATRTQVGDHIDVRFTVLDRTRIDIPEDLMNTLRAENAEESFKSLSQGKQNYLVRCINEATKPQTREKRIREALAVAQSAA